MQLPLLSTPGFLPKIPNLKNVQQNRVRDIQQIKNNSSIQKPVGTNIKVCTRIRPLLPFEIQRGDKSSVIWKSDTQLEVRKTDGSRTFSFDLIHSDNACQSDVFEKSNVPAVLDSVLDGFSATILAYGQTGSGKTFT